MYEAEDVPAQLTEDLDIVTAQEAFEEGYMMAQVNFKLVIAHF